MDTYVDYLQDALIIVSAWEIPEGEFAQAVNDQAHLMCGQNLEPSGELPQYSPYAALRF